MLTPVIEGDPLPSMPEFGPVDPDAEESHLGASGRKIAPSEQTPPPFFNGAMTSSVLLRGTRQLMWRYISERPSWDEHWGAMPWAIGVRTKWLVFNRSRSRECIRYRELNHGSWAPRDVADNWVTSYYETRVESAERMVLKGDTNVPERHRGCRQYRDALKYRHACLAQGYPPTEEERRWAYIYFRRQGVFPGNDIVPPPNVYLHTTKRRYYADLYSDEHIRLQESMAAHRMRRDDPDWVEWQYSPIPRSCKHARVEGLTQVPVGQRPVTYTSPEDHINTVAHEPGMEWLAHYLPGILSGRIEGGLDVNWMVMEDMATAPSGKGDTHLLYRAIQGFGERLRLPRLPMPPMERIQHVRINPDALPGPLMSHIGHDKGRVETTAAAIATCAWERIARHGAVDCSLSHVGGRDKVNDPPQDALLRGRLVTQGEMPVALICSVFSQPIGDMIHRDPRRVLGIGESLWGRINERWNKVRGRHGMYLDWSAFGPRTRDILIVAALGLAFSCYLEDAEKHQRVEELENLFAWMASTTVTKRYLTPGGLILRVASGMPDGSPWTTVGDGLANWLILVTTAMDVMGWELTRQLDISVCGDDSETLFPPDEEDWDSPNVTEFVRTAESLWGVRGKPTQSYFGPTEWTDDAGRLMRSKLRDEGGGPKYLGWVVVNGAVTRPLRDWIRILSLPPKRYSDTVGKEHKLRSLIDVAPIVTPKVRALVQSYCRTASLGSTLGQRGPEFTDLMLRQGAAQHYSPQHADVPRHWLKNRPVALLQAEFDYVYNLIHSYPRDQWLKHDHVILAGRSVQDSVIIGQYLLMTGGYPSTSRTRRRRGSRGGGH